MCSGRGKPRRNLRRDSARHRQILAVGNPGRETMARGKRRIKAGEDSAGSQACEVLLNPHKINGENSCLLTTREKLNAPPPVTPSEQAQRLRRLFEQFIASLDGHGAVL